MSDSESHKSERLEIGPCPASRQIRGLWYALESCPPSTRAARIAVIVRAIGRGEISWDGLFEARRGQRIVGAVWSYLMPGRQAILVPPAVVVGEDLSTVNHLLAATEEFMVRSATKTAQAFVSPNATEEIDRLVDFGFHKVATILTLQCQTASAIEPHQEELQFVEFSDADESRLKRLIEQTYVGSLDCPAIDGVRILDDVLVGYRNTGQFASNRWLFVQHHGSDVGCLLLTDHVDQQQWELVYMGLTPISRGRRWGRILAAEAVWRCRCAGRGAITVAVDQANQPAIAAYSQAGFEEIDRQVVLLKRLPPTA